MLELIILILLGFGISGILSALNSAEREKPLGFVRGLGCFIGIGLILGSIAVFFLLSGCAFMSVRTSFCSNATFIFIGIIAMGLLGIILLVVAMVAWLGSDKPRVTTPKEKMQSALDLMRQKHYDEAREILESVDHPNAGKWLAQLDKLALKAKSGTISSEHSAEVED